MATKMYKEQVSKKVRGYQVEAHLKDGWTFEPSKTKSTPRRGSRDRITVKEVDIIKPDLEGPEDLTTIEE
jgi:hypothetical protein